MNWHDARKEYWEGYSSHKPLRARAEVLHVMSTVRSNNGVMSTIRRRLGTRQCKHMSSDDTQITSHVYDIILQLNTRISG